MTCFDNAANDVTVLMLYECVLNNSIEHRKKAWEIFWETFRRELSQNIFMFLISKFNLLNKKTRPLTFDR